MSVSKYTKKSKIEMNAVRLIEMNAVCLIEMNAVRLIEMNAVRLIEMNAVRLTRNGHTSIFSPILEVKPSA